MTPEARARLQEILDDPNSWDSRTIPADASPPPSSRQALLQNLSDSLPLVTFLFDTGDDHGDYALEYVSENVERVAGCSRGQALAMGPRVIELIHPDDLRGMFVGLRQAREEMSTWRFSARVRGGAGQEWRWYSGWVMPEQTPGRLQWYGALLDVHEARLAELRSMEMLGRFEAVFNASFRALTIVDPDRRIIKYNEKAADVALRRGGLVYEEGVRLDDLGFHADQLEALHQGISSALGGELLHVDWSSEDAHGVERQYEVTFVPLRGAAGEVDSALIVGEEVTDRRRTELERSMWDAHMANAQRIEALGLMAGGVAHDFNNMLMLISTHASMIGFEFEDALGDDMDLVERIVPEIDAIEQAVVRAKSMTTQLLEFAGRQLVEPVSILPAAALAECAAAMRGAVGLETELILAPIESSWRIVIDPGQLEQIMTNLVLNAGDAIEEAGQIGLSASEEVVREERVLRGCVLRPGEYVVLEVTDDGCGISAHDLSRIFDPFFTTKRMGVSTGLGLASCFGIARGAGGAIDCVSEVGVGTTFRVWLPRALGAAPMGLRESSQDLGGGSRRRVLLAEDQYELRAALERLLRRHGYEVVSCADGGEVIERLKVDRDFALLLTDVVMPNLGGVEAARAFSEILPNAPVVFMSGYVDDMLFSRELESGALFVQKPCASSHLVEVLERALEGVTH